METLHGSLFSCTDDSHSIDKRVMFHIDICKPGVAEDDFPMIRFRIGISIVVEI